MNTPLISIIVPVYNVEKILYKCVNSILSQTYTDFELLLINDGSTDMSGRICDKYAEKDNRVRVFHKENSGGAGARNVGLDNMRGKWTVFVDSDDWVGEKYLESFFYDKDIDERTHVIQGFRSVDDNGKITKAYPSRQYPFETISSANYRESIIKHRLLHKWGIWAKLFSSKIIQKESIRFNSNIKKKHDGPFWHQYLLYVDKIVLLPAQEYRYVRPSDNRLTVSLMKQNYISFYTLACIYKSLAFKLINKFNLNNSKYSKSAVTSLYLSNITAAYKDYSSIDKEGQRFFKNILPSRNLIWKYYEPATIEGYIFKLLYCIFPFSFISLIVSSTKK